MNTNTPFQSQFRPDLALKRRGLTIPPRAGSSSPFPEEGPPVSYQEALQAAWDKLYRARAILEAEQAHLRDDRIALQGELESIQQREQMVAAREQRLLQLEQQAELDRAEEEAARLGQSALGRITRVPFDMARSVFSARR
jgi:hypothetical protein